MRFLKPLPLWDLELLREKRGMERKRWKEGVDEQKVVICLETNIVEQKRREDVKLVCSVCVRVGVCVTEMEGR